MSRDPKLFKINSNKKEPTDMEEVEFADLGFKERSDIQEWIAAYSGILDHELLIIAKEYGEFDQTRERLDLLAVDRKGQLVVIELKRDDSGNDAHWQAVKYASYIRSLEKEEIVDLLARNRKITGDEARQQLVEHIDFDEELDRLNDNQRIILASHRFSRAVTSAALWLNEQAGRDLVTCIQLTPYKDPEFDNLYLMANTIIPVPGAESYFIRLRGRSQLGTNRQSNGSDRQNDPITQFCRAVRTGVLEKLPDELKPNRESRWAGIDNSVRYFHLWYDKEDPWGNWDMAYRITLADTIDEKKNKIWKTSVGIIHRSVPEQLQLQLREINIIDGVVKIRNQAWVWRQSETLDEAFCQALADTLCSIIESVTPIVRKIMEETDLENA